MAAGEAQVGQLQAQQQETTPQACSAAQRQHGSLQLPRQLTVLLQHLVALVDDEELQLLQAEVLLQHQLQEQEARSRGRQQTNTGTGAELLSAGCSAVRRHNVHATHLLT